MSALHQQTKILHVAVGLIMRDQQVLISWRHAGLHQGNRHEFPGGKIEADETPLAGLQRELREELGIQVHRAIRTQQLVYSYPERTVCLHVFKVTDFTGEPQGQEGQQTQWVAVDDLTRYTFPDANAPILRAARLPAHYLISHDQMEDQALEQWVDLHVQRVPNGAWLYVRHYGLASAQYQQVVTSLHQHRPDLQLVVMQQHVNVLGDLLHNLAGVHVGRNRQLVDWSVIPQHVLRFAACHDQAQIEQAMQWRVDAITLGAVQPTLTHPERVALGWEAWQQLCAQSQLPVYALGGVGPNDLTQVQLAGGFGVAGIRAFY